MFLVLHSLSGALRYLRPDEKAGNDENSEPKMEKMIGEIHDENICPTCKHSLDVIAPLPSEELKRRSSGHMAYSTHSYGQDPVGSFVQGRDQSPRTRVRFLRSRHKSDNHTSRLLDMAPKSSCSPESLSRLVLTRNPSDPKFDTVVSGDDMVASQNVAALPRTLSTSVLRIKQRRSFWEKFLK